MKRILVIDDSPLIREVACMALGQGPEWEASAVDSGADGVTTAAAERPDAILLDVEMPELDGPQTFARLQADPDTQGIPVILVTAADRPEERSRLDALGVAGVIPKPFDAAGLPDRVAEILGWER